MKRAIQARGTGFVLIMQKTAMLYFCLAPLMGQLKRKALIFVPRLHTLSPHQERRQDTDIESNLTVLK